jgi:RNA polymerase sigma-70 factor, ECF subfamily
MSLAEANRGNGQASPIQGKIPLDFAAQFEGSFRVLWLVAMSIVTHRTDAEDVVQEAALLALSKLDQFQPGTNFRAWMAQMVRYVALNYVRKRQKHRAGSIDTNPEDGSSIFAAPADPGRLQMNHMGQLPTDQPFFDDQIIVALASIDETARACLLLRTIENMEYSEIARVLNIPPGTAMSHVHRTRQYLRESLSHMNPMSRKDIRQ